MIMCVTEKYTDLRKAMKRICKLNLFLFDSLVLTDFAHQKGLYFVWRIIAVYRRTLQKADSATDRLHLPPHEKMIINFYAALIKRIMTIHRIDHCLRVSKRSVEHVATNINNTHFIGG